MKKGKIIFFLIVVIIVLFLFLVLFLRDMRGQKEFISIGIIQITDHPSLNATRDGFIEFLRENGYVDGINLLIDYQNAQGNREIAEQIAREFSNKNLDLILAISSQSLKAVSKYQDNCPIIFAAVTDPIGSGLVNPEDPQPIVGGVTDLTPVWEQFNLLKQLVPETKKVGVLYNSTQKYSLLQVKLAQDYAQQHGLEVILEPINDENEAVKRVKSLLGEVDAIYLPTDPTIYGKVEEMVLWANLAQKPIITGELEGVKKGALASIAVNYYQLGRQAGKMALQVINEGMNNVEFRINNCEQNDIFINKESAQLLGIKIPQSLIHKSQII